MNKKINSLINDIGMIKELNKSLNMDIDNLNSKIDGLNSKIKALQSTNATWYNDINNYKLLIKKYLDEIDAKNEKLKLLDKVMERNNNLEKQLDDANNMRSEINNNYNKASLEFDGDRKDWVIKINQLTSAYNKLEKEIQDLRDENEQLKLKEDELLGVI